MRQRWHGAALVGLAALGVLGVACQANPEGAKLIVVFVDVSGSVKDFDVYRDAWSKVVDGGRLKGGDRIILARITGETYTRFHPILDRELPKFNFLTDNKLTYEKKAKKIREEVSQALARALEAPRSPQTDVMNALVLAAQMFEGDHGRRHVLVILSDMLEDSEEYRFETAHINDDFIGQIIEKKQQRELLPDLGGASVYVAGASGRSAAKAHEVQRFWRQYMEAANANLLHYGPSLTYFNE